MKKKHIVVIENFKYVQVLSKFQITRKSWKKVFKTPLSPHNYMHACMHRKANNN